MESVAIAMSRVPYLFNPYYGYQMTKLNQVWKSVKGYFHNGNRTEWRTIRSIIIQVINKLGRPRSLL